mmetsp:Transcript_49644/g.115830  ORF Transcript_49644/g.115830 Transcript_49644/m.115830 type:complete len:294 (-) Transcript_49644:418-1299(-)
MDSAWGSMLARPLASCSDGSSEADDSVKPSTMRTPLSSKAKPFQSANVAGCRSSFSTSFADSTKYPYSPELQDYVYLHLGNATPSAISGEESAGAMEIPPSIYSGEEEGAQRLLRESRPIRFASRTPSPEMVSHYSPTPSRQLPCVPLNEPCPIELYTDETVENAGEAENVKNSQDRQVLEKVPILVKRTFVHFDDEGSEMQADGALWKRPRRSASAPARLLFHNPDLMIEEHLKGTCKPCGYFFAKADGCRWKDTCSFCHLCPPGELKRRKKQKRAMLRARDMETSPMVAPA